MISSVIKYRKDIEGLRALAVISVFLFHLNPKLLPGGFVGVDIFFVISGYLITKIILREIELDQFSFLGFYIRRIRRIFPALFLMFFVSLVMAVLFLGPLDLIWFCKTLKYSLLQISNILFEKKVEYFDAEFDSVPLLHTWSLAVEEQFYLIFPIILTVIFKLKKDNKFPLLILISLCIFSLISSQFLLQKHPRFSFFSLISRFWEIGLGGILAFYKVDKKNFLIRELASCAGFCLVIFSLFFTESRSFPGVYALPSCVGAFLIIYGGSFGQSFVGKILGSKIPVFFGLISYSIYLWHFPVIEFYKISSASKEIGSTESLAIFVSVSLISWLSFKYVESPFRKVRSIEDEKRVRVGNRSFYLVFIILIAAISIFFVTSRIVVKWQKNHVERIFGDSANGKFGSFNPECLIENKLDQSVEFISRCVVGENKKNFDVLLIGDSHAWRYGNGLISWAKNKNYSMAVIASTACPSFIGGSQFCDDLRSMINRIVVENKSLKYVILANKWDDDVSMGAEFAEKITQNIRFYRESGKQVIILGLVPIFTFDPAKCVSENNSVFKRLASNTKHQVCDRIERSIASPENDFLESFFVKLSSDLDAKYFDPKKYLCDRDYCYSIMDGEVLYTDKNHLDFEGSNFVSSHFDF